MLPAARRAGAGVAIDSERPRMAESQVETAPQHSAGTSAVSARHVDQGTLKGRSLREHAARGTLINASFQIGLAVLGASRRFFIAIFLTAADYGLWGLIYTAVVSILFLKDVGIGDKYIQQDD